MMDIKNTLRLSYNREMFIEKEHLHRNDPQLAGTLFIPIKLASLYYLPNDTLKCTVNGGARQTE